MTDEQVTPQAEPYEDPLAGFDRGLGEDGAAFTLPEEEQTVNEETTAEVPPVFNIDGEEITLDQIKEWKADGLRQADYTRKTQEIAEQRRQIEAMAQNPAEVVLNAINTLPPDQRRQMAAEFAQMQGLNVVGFAPTPGQTGVSATQGAIPADWDDWTPNEQRLWLEKEAIGNQLKQLGGALGEIKGFIQTQREEATLAQAANAATQTIKEQTGADVSASELADLVKRTGIKDPVAAWWSENGPKVARGAFKQGAQTAAKPAPAGGQSKTFDPFDMSLSDVEVLRMIDQGYTPVPGAR